jgi:integrase
VAVVLQVFRWGIDRDLVPTSKLLAYRQERSRDDRAAQVDAYTRAEVAALLDGLAMAPRDPVDWRLYALTVVLAFAGPRQRAARHLEWRDVDLDGARLHWRGELDKMAEDRWQPVPAVVVEALWVAYGWRVAMDYRGPFVFYRPAMARAEIDARKRGSFLPSRRKAARAEALAAAGKDQPWTYGAYWLRLKRLEDAVGVDHKPLRAAHGMRRHVVTQLLRRTKNLVLAGNYVGDRDLRTLTKSYVRQGEEELREAGALLDDFDAAIPADPTPAAPAPDDPKPEGRADA